MKTLLWLDINCSFVHSSLALPAIHAQCGDEQVNWKVVSATLSTPMGTLVEDIVKAQPDIIAATTWLFTHDYLLNIIARTKALLPNVIVILGGPEFLGENEIYLQRHPEIDFAFRGEGELEFPKWLTQFNGDKDWNDVEGLCWIDGNGYHDNGNAKVANIAALAPPEGSRFFNWTKPFVQLETTRGCFNSCTFCVSGADKPVRNIPTDTVRERIANIHAHGIREIRLLDRTFNYDLQRATELINIFSEFPDMRFHLELHPALLPAKLRTLLSSLPANLLHLEAGIQSLNENVLNACGRKGGLDKALDGLRFLCSLDNMETHTDLIAGLPDYSLEQIFKDISTLAEYGAGEIQLELLKVLPGTAMRRNAQKLGLKYSPMPPYEILSSNEMSITEMQTARLLSRLLDFYYNNKAWHKVTTELILSDSTFLPSFLDWMRSGDRLEQPLSVEKRGLLLFEYIVEQAPANIKSIETAWLEARLSPRKIERFF